LPATQWQFPRINFLELLFLELLSRSLTASEVQFASSQCWRQIGLACEAGEHFTNRAGVLPEPPGQRVEHEIDHLRVEEIGAEHDEDGDGKHNVAKSESGHGGHQFCKQKNPLLKI